MPRKLPKSLTLSSPSSDSQVFPNFSSELTDLHDPPKHRGVVHGAAVPPPLPELVLALLNARLGSVSNVHHMVLIQLAQLPLAL